jgi:hypothetical protein
LPLASFGGNLQAAAIFLLENIDGIVLAGESSCKVLATIIVDKDKMGLVTFDGGRRDEPCECIVLLAEKTRHLSEKILSRDPYVLVIKIYAEIYIKFIII